jgi:hypothetical protein
VNRRSWTGVVVVLIVSFSYFLPAPAARARPVDNNGACEDGELCLWRDANFSGCFFDWASEINVDNLKSVKYDTCPDQKLGDSISSYRNNYADYTLFLAEHPDFKGYHYCVEGRASGNVIPGFNDKASALAWTGTISNEDFKCNHIDQD